MFFHVDESGNTGNQLFDKNQPILTYGVLSSTLNVDALGKQWFKDITKKLDIDCLHANHLGVNKLTEISRELYLLQDKFKFSFDYYFIEKRALAVVCLFDAIFDAGINPAVRWDTYWTPMRYLIILKLAAILDDDILKKTWALCTCKYIENKESDIIQTLEEIRSITKTSCLDARSKEIIINALGFAIKNPLAMDFGQHDEKAISPNAVGFQFVASSISRRLKLKNRKKALSITVDMQTQFNKAQIETYRNASLISDGMKRATQEDRNKYLNHPLFASIEKSDLINKNLINSNIEISKSQESIGLQIVDIYLWITNRILLKKELSTELHVIGSLFLKQSFVDGISFSGMEGRFKRFESILPDLENITKEQADMARKFMDAHRSTLNDLGL